MYPIVATREKFSRCTIILMKNFWDPFFYCCSQRRAFSSCLVHSSIYNSHLLLEMRYPWAWKRERTITRRLHTKILCRCENMFWSGMGAVILGMKIKDSAFGPLHTRATHSQFRKRLHSVASPDIMTAPRRRSHDCTEEISTCRRIPMKGVVLSSHCGPWQL